MKEVTLHLVNSLANQSLTSDEKLDDYLSDEKLDNAYNLGYKEGRIALAKDILSYEEE